MPQFKVVVESNHIAFTDVFTSEKKLQKTLANVRANHERYCSRIAPKPRFADPELQTIAEQHAADALTVHEITRRINAWHHYREKLKTCFLRVSICQI